MTSKRNRLLVIAQYYTPEPNFITSDVAEAMARRADVVVIAAQPNYGQDWFYPGTRWWRPRRTEENGAVVWRLPMMPYHGRSQMRRALSYLSFGLLATLWAPWVAGRPSVVWIYQTPFTLAFAALWFRVVYGSRLIYTYADLWPEAFVAAGVARPGAVMRLLFATRRWFNRRAAAIICSTRGTLARFAEEGIDVGRLHYVPVWVDGIDLRRQPAPGTGARRIVYAGNLGPAQALDTLIRAAARWQREGIDVGVDLYGTGNSEQELRALASELGAPDVVFHGRVPPAHAFEVSSRAFAQIVSLQPSPLFAMSVPSKISFCCAAGAPVLYALQGEPAAMLAASAGGIPFEVTDPQSLVAAVKDLLGRSEEDRMRMRDSLRRYYQENLARPLLLEQYEQILLAHASRERESTSAALLGGRQVP